MTQIPDRQDQLEALVRTEHHGTRESKPQRSVGDRSRFANRGRSTLSDEGLIRRCRRSTDAERFASLFDRGETHAYGHDHSRADLALVSMLSQFSRDAEQLDRLFRRSALCRKKWTEREDYRRLTIERALAHSPTKPGPSQEVLDALEAIEAEMWRRPWRGKAGQSQWKIMHALIAAAMEHGEMIPAGVRVGISRRQIAEDAGISDSTAKKQIKALRRRGELRGDNLDRKPDDAGALVILVPGDYRPDHGATAEPGDGDSAKLPHPSTGGGGHNRVREWVGFAEYAIERGRGEAARPVGRTRHRGAPQVRWRGHAKGAAEPPGNALPQRRETGSGSCGGVWRGGAGGRTGAVI